MDTPHRAARRLLTSAAVGSLLVALVHAAGCAFAPARADTAGGPSVRTATDGPDARFIRAAERSSAWAVHMAELEIINGARADVKATAKVIKDRETINLSMLARERARLGLPAGVGDHHGDPHMDADEERLRMTKGDEADALFVQHMLEQRRDIIALAHFARPELASVTLVEFARLLPDERDKDVAELHRVEFAGGPVPANSRAALGIKSVPVKTAVAPPRR